MGPFRHALSRAAEDRLLVALLLALAGLLWWQPLAPARLFDLVHWQTIVALTGLMLLSRGLEASGALARLGAWLLRRLHSERGLALALVLFSGVLAAVVTNDVALFVVVPLTLGLYATADLPVGRLVVFEALAVNAGSAATPVGNPQNLLLWQSSGTGFLEFTAAIAPLAIVLMGLILLLVPLAFPRRALAPVPVATGTPLTPRLAGVMLVMYPLFLLLVEGGLALPGLAIALLACLVLRPRMLYGVDWELIAVFVLMFLVIGIVVESPAVARSAAALDILPGGLITSGMLVSQVVSNVPAAILLNPFADDWRLLAWGVNVGGFGLAVGSMANLIALRLARRPGIWRDFHRWSVPMLVLAWASALGLNGLLLG